MKSIIEKLFYDEIEQNTLPKENKLSKDENEIFEKLRSGLTDEQKSLLLEFDDLKNERLLEDEKELYILCLRCSSARFRFLSERGRCTSSK
jgi:DNA replication initiation complex subunit (GINS family)